MSWKAAFGTAILISLVNYAPFLSQYSYEEIIEIDKMKLTYNSLKFIVFEWLAIVLVLKGFTHYKASKN